MDARFPEVPSAVRAKFVGLLTVTWWAKNVRGSWKQVSHRPLELTFRDSEELKLELTKFAREEHWEHVQATRTDLDLKTVLFDANPQAAKRPVNFDKQATHFLQALRAGGRSRCGLLVYLRAGL